VKNASAYYEIMKPGIVKGNVMMTVAGFLFAAQGNIDITKLIWVSLGVSLVIAGACVANNVLDINIDKIMNRTKTRPLITGAISVRKAVIFSVILGLLGLSILIGFTNMTVFLLGILAWLNYVIVYGYVKRRSTYGTAVGGVSGALPPVAGYVALSGNLDTSVLWIFITMIVWQMPHFYAIGIFRLSDYRSAKIPIYPVVKDVSLAKLHILLYVVAFGAISPMLGFVGKASKVFGISMFIISLGWLYLSVRDYKTSDYSAWAKKVFVGSLVSLVSFAVLLSVDSFFQ
jgi:protoheme IX farnesyltransferase